VRMHSSVDTSDESSGTASMAIFWSCALIINVVSVEEFIADVNINQHVGRLFPASSTLSLTARPRPDGELGMGLCTWSRYRWSSVNHRACFRHHEEARRQRRVPHVFPRNLVSLKHFCIAGRFEYM
jgi:hypothetical protein